MVFVDELRIASVWCAAVGVDVVDGFVERVDDFHADDEAEVLGVPVLRRSAGLASGNSLRARSSPRDFDFLAREIAADSGSRLFATDLVDEQMLDGVADCAAGVAGLGVDADVADLLFDAGNFAVDVDVAVAGEMLEDGDGGILDDGADEAFAAAGDDEVDVLVELEDQAGRGRGRWIRRVGRRARATED